jgi:hypothetical protein
LLIFIKFEFEIFIFLFFPVILFSQNTISIKISDENKLAVSRAIVIVSKEDNQVAFGTTDSEVFFDKTPSGVYVFNIKLGYTPIMEVVLVKESVALVL